MYFQCESQHQGVVWDLTFIRHYFKTKRTLRSRNLCNATVRCRGQFSERSACELLRLISLWLWWSLIANYSVETFRLLFIRRWRRGQNVTLMYLWLHGLRSKNWKHNINLVSFLNFHLERGVKIYVLKKYQLILKSVRVALTYQTSLRKSS